MNFQKFLLVLGARRKVIWITLLVCVALSLAFSLLWPKSYTATTAIVLDAKPDPLNSLAMMGGGSQSFTYLATQIEIIQSERVAGKVVKSLRFDEDPEVIKDWKAETDGRGDIVIWLARILLNKLEVKPERDSNIVNIRYTARNPKLAATIANHFAQAYVDTSLELKIEPARQYASWFVTRTKAMRDELEKAQERLSENQREKGIVAVDERLDVENARLADLSAQLTAVQAQTADTFSRQTQARGDKDILPEVLQSTLVQTLKADIARGEAKLQELGGQLGENHPQYKRSEMELKTLRQKVELETGKVASSISSANRVNMQRETEIKASLEAQKLKVLKLKRQRDEIAVMQRDVEGAQRSYENVMQRLNQSSLESQVDQTNVVILHPATEPVDPSKPKLLLNIVLSIVIGLLLGIGLALRREMTDFRIRLIEDVTELLKLPVLGIVESPSIAPRTSGWSFWLRWRQGRFAGAKSWT